jgi:hypothetical protein
MIIPQDEQFRREREQYALRFNCEDCAMFEPANGSCAHGYPTERHRKARYEDPDANVLFCKEFDLA